MSETLSTQSDATSVLAAWQNFAVMQDANLQAAAETKQHDAAVEAQIEAKYTPVIAAIKKQSNDYQKQVTRYERTILAHKSADAGGRCLLGIHALRLRGR